VLLVFKFFLFNFVFNLKLFDMNILILWNDSKNVASTVFSHVKSIKKYSKNNVFLLNIIKNIPHNFDLSKFDVVVIHYSLFLYSRSYVSIDLLRKLSEFNGIKCIFIQDEYRNVDMVIDAMLSIGVDVVFTCVPSSEIEKVYPEEKLPGVLKVNVLTGYVDTALLNYPVPRYEDRTVDIGYRARKPPVYLGELGQEKWRIGQRVGEDAKRMGLIVDLAYREEERLYGDAWIKFVSNCKAVLGVESGASVFDFTGEVAKNVTRALQENPNLCFIELQKRFFFDLEGHIKLNQISPRCFEAASLKTLMILYEGDYSGRLIPWRHYLPLKKDHSNFSEIVSCLKNEKYAQEIINNAYLEVALNPINSFQAMVQIFDESVEKIKHKKDEIVRIYYSEAELLEIQKSARKINLYANFKRKIIFFVYKFIFKFMMFFFSEKQRDVVHRWLSNNLKYF